METTYLVVKDETGVVRPMAGIWKNDEAGKISSEKFINHDPECTIVKIKIEEISHE